MPRAKTYIRSAAVEKARNAFWKHGFDALGVRAIEAHTGLNRFAIQTEFGGKEGLFLEALENYAHLSLETIIKPIGEGDLAAIKRFFDEMTTPRANDLRVYGCLMVNTVVENATHQRAALKKRTDKHYKKMQDAFETALGNAKDQGALSADFDVEAAASYLLALAMGIQVHIRMTGSVSAARQQSKMALNVLDCWRVKAGSAGTLTGGAKKN